MHDKINFLNAPEGASAGDAPKTAEVPSTFDWRDVDGNNYITSIKTQGKCESCAAFSTAAAVEANARINLKLPVNKTGDIQFEDLSEAQLYFCNAIDCGIFLEIGDAFAYCRDTGLLPRSACAPYTPLMEACNQGNCIGQVENFRDKYCHTDGSQNTLISGFKKLTDNREVKEWIVSTGPVVFAIEVDLPFMTYKGGSIITCGGDYGHAVCVIGFDDSKDAWLCKNSMGPDWGDNGFFWLKYGQIGDCISKAYGIEGFTKIYTTKTK